MIIRIFAASVPTKPLNDAQMRGAFFVYTFYSQNTLMERLPHFTKHYMTEADLVALLKTCRNFSWFIHGKNLLLHKNKGELK